MRTYLIVAELQRSRTYEQFDEAMPRGPKGVKRPSDVIGNAIRVAQIATGEAVEDFPSNDGKDKTAHVVGRKGGQNRAESMTPERRAEIARKARTTTRRTKNE